MLEVLRNSAHFQVSLLMSKVPSMRDVRPPLVKVHAPAAMSHLQCGQGEGGHHATLLLMVLYTPTAAAPQVSQARNTTSAASSVDTPTAKPATR